MEIIIRSAHDLLLGFIPLFVAMDAVGVLPFVLSLTQEMEKRERTRAVRYAMLTALGLGLGFIAVGKFVFLALGIASADFLIAGGLLLLVLSIKDIATGKIIEAEVPMGKQAVGVVPMGTPLIVGPAVLTTLLLLIEQYPIWIVLLCFVLNLAFAWLIFNQANRVAGFLGLAGLKATSKIASLLLAAIAVKMIRQGILGILSV
jgi:multiple antibiotic resistance protein